MNRNHFEWEFVGKERKESANRKTFRAVSQARLIHKQLRVSCSILQCIHQSNSSSKSVSVSQNPSEVNPQLRFREIYVFN